METVRILAELCCQLFGLLVLFCIGMLVILSFISWVIFYVWDRIDTKRVMKSKKRSRK